MGPGSREMLLLVVVAVLVSISGPAEGFLFNRLARQNSEGNKVSDDTVVESKPHPTQLNVGCRCDEPPSFACSCGVNLTANVLGQRIEFDPKVNVEFHPLDASISLSVTNQGKTLFARDIDGDDYIPPVCVPVPQVPVVALCLQPQNASIDIQNKTVSFNLVLGINSYPIPLLKGPRIPVGSFTASQKSGIAYKPPVFKMPGKEAIDKLFAMIPKIPSSPDNWPFGGNKQEMPWPFGNKGNAKDEDIARLAENLGGILADMFAGADAGTNAEANTNAGISVRA